ncbi:geranylgeranyl reductase [Thioalkalivibrio sp. K90mix]|uniref:geranylgeranyl reductase family protein n=1 Tax=Thioalkalivibrio sp. (strain K90mix) TaxID=396595 RepID=UPI000195A37D|nr:NAD(P)/FAD-dependent oxidoreductase [Thioalkalivibrio sp. K90mix]ADC71158.1 geranylgeranyl reductase [Thioalkalivibrio sp. K90mix]
MLPEKVDVLVVGLGPGGASAARVCAAAGLSVLAVERNKAFGEPVQCAEFIPNPMGAYARAEGVLLQRIDSMQSFLPSGTVEHSDFPGLMVDRGEFDRAIIQAAQANGAQLVTSTPLQRVDAERHVATVKHQGQEHRVEYRVLIAADGPHSPVAESLGLPALPVVQTRQYTVPLKKPYTATDVWLSDDYPGGYAWLFPKGEWANLGLGADKRIDNDMKTPLESLHVQLVEQGLLGEEIRHRTGGAIPVGGLRDSLYQGDVLFVGDAGGFTHPITGAGIAAAVVSGEAAGEAAIGHLEGDAEAFDDYDEDMRDQYGPALERACKRRAFLNEHWRTPRAQEDATQRRGWIAFSEYFNDGDQAA